MTRTEWYFDRLDVLREVAAISAALDRLEQHSGCPLLEIDELRQRANAVYDNVCAELLASATNTAVM
jgi:hypothetical protein